MDEDDCEFQINLTIENKQEDGPLRKPGSRKMKNQILAALAVTLGGFITGTMLGWSSPGIPSLEESEDCGILSAQDKSWIGSIANLGAAFSGFAAGFCIEKFGRKNTMLILSVPCILGWVLLASSQNIAMILAGRVVTGFATACFTLVGPVYISEVVEADVRGTLCTIFSFVLCSGILFMYVLGTFVSWIWLSIVSAIIPVIMVIGISFVPETPSFLLSRGRREEAVASLKWLRGTNDASDIEGELKMLQKSIQEDSKQSASLRDLLQPSIFKPLCISMSLMLFQQLGGINAVLFYSVNIFRDAGSNINPNLSAIILAAVQVAFVGISTILVDRTGRRVLFIFSEAGMTISLSVLGLYFFLKFQNDNIAPENLGWLPLGSLVAYIITYNIFLGAGPWLMMAELLPARVKGLASAIATSFCWLLAFIVTKTFEDLSTAIEPHGCYWLFAGVSAFGIVFGFLLLPETKGKSLVEIQRQFTRSQPKFRELLI